MIRPHPRRCVRSADSSLAALLALVCLGVGATSAGAQEIPDTSGILVRGEVLDAFSSQPVPFALVELDGFGRTMTDDGGRFQLRVPYGGPHVLLASQLGYVTLQQRMDLSDGDVLSVELIPKPLVLEGIQVIVDRLERRRRAMPYTVRSTDFQSILSSGALDGRDVVERLTLTPIFACGLDDCLMVRGRFQGLRLVIDEAQEWGGLAALRNYSITDLHAVEYIPRCGLVRVYTKWFMEMKARGRSSFFPDLCDFR